MKVDSFDTNMLLNSTQYLQNEIDVKCLKVSHRLETDLELSFRQEISDLLNKSAAEIIKDGFHQITNDALNVSINEAMDAVNVDLDIAKQSYVAANRLCLAEATTSLKIKKETIENKLALGDSKVLSVKDQLISDLEEFNSAYNYTKHATSKILNNHVSKTLLVSPFGESVIGDTYASMIARAPEKYWQKYKKNINIATDDNLSDYKTQPSTKARYNHAKIQTFLGNADLAIKMDSPGTFTIKGVRLDADEAIKASFDVLRQGIKYVAYSSGISVTEPASSNEENTLGAMPEIEENKQLEQKITELKRKQRENLKNLLAQIMAKKEGISAPDVAERKQALESIKRAYSIYKAN